jgi:hypothetical protein
MKGKKFDMEEAFSRAFDSLCDRCKQCAEVGGDYT